MPQAARTYLPETRCSSSWWAVFAVYLMMADTCTAALAAAGMNLLAL